MIAMLIKKLQLYSNFNIIEKILKSRFKYKIGKLDYKWLRKENWVKTSN